MGALRNRERGVCYVCRRDERRTDIAYALVGSEEILEERRSCIRVKVKETAERVLPVSVLHWKGAPCR